MLNRAKMQIAFYGSTPNYAFQFEDLGFDGVTPQLGKMMKGEAEFDAADAVDTGDGVFAGLDNPFIATRYHSLVIDKNTLPDCLEITAWTETENGEVDEIMGVRHKELNVEGVQFHPESILTEHGHDLLKNFLAA